MQTTLRGGEPPIRKSGHPGEEEAMGVSRVSSGILGVYLLKLRGGLGLCIFPHSESSALPPAPGDIPVEVQSSKEGVPKTPPHPARSCPLPCPQRVQGRCPSVKTPCDARGPLLWVPVAPPVPSQLRLLCWGQPLPPPPLPPRWA